MTTNKHKELWDDILGTIRKRMRGGESQSALARQLGVNRATLCRWLAEERGGKRASMDALLGYMRELNMDPSGYFGEAPAGQEVFVPWLRVDLPDNGGQAVLSTEVPSHLGFSRGWLLSKGSPGHMAVTRADGRMALSIPEGAAVLVSLERKPPVDGKVYLVRLGREVTLARVRLDGDRNVQALYGDDGGAALRVTAEEPFEVLGRALWFGADVG